MDTSKTNFKDWLLGGGGGAMIIFNETLSKKCSASLTPLIGYFLKQEFKNKNGIY